MSLRGPDALKWVPEPHGIFSTPAGGFGSQLFEGQRWIFPGQVGDEMIGVTGGCDGVSGYAPVQVWNIRSRSCAVVHLSCVINYTWAVPI